MVNNSFRVFFRFILVLCIISCRQGDENLTCAHRGFKGFFKLNGVYKDLEMDVKPAEIKVIPHKNIILLLDPRQEFMIKIFSLDSMRFIREFFKKGTFSDGPVNARNLQYSEERKEVYIADMYKKDVYTFDVDSLLNSIVIPKKVKKIDAKYLGNPLVFGDTIYESRINIKGEHTVKHFNIYKEGVFEKSFGDFPDSDILYPNILSFDVFKGRFGLNNIRKEFLFAYYYTNVLDLYDINGELIKRVKGACPFTPKLNVNESSNGGLSVLMNNETRIGYTGTPRYHKNSYFILYDGALTEDRGDYHVNSLLKYSDELENEDFFKLDKSIFEFDIDGTKLYGLTHEEPNSLVIFDLDDNRYKSILN